MLRERKHAWLVGAGVALVLLSEIPVLIARGVTGWELLTRFLGLLALLAAAVSWAGADRQALRDLVRRARAAVVTERTAAAALAAIVALGVAVRIPFLGDAMRYDEAYTYMHYGSGRLLTALTLMDLPNNHVLHTALLWLSTHVFGTEPAAIRIPAFVAGVAVVPATYVVGRVHYGNATGLLAAALVASSAALITYSTNARGYSMVTFFFLVLLAAVPSLARPGARTAWVVFVVAAVLCLYTTPTGLFGVAIATTAAALGAVDLARRTVDREIARKLGIAVVSIGLASAVLYSSAHEVPGWWHEPRGALSEDVAAGIWSDWNRDLPAVLRAVLVAGFAAGVIAHRRVARHAVPLVAAAAIVLIPLALADRVLHFTRVWLFLLPLYLIVASAGIVAGARLLARRLRLPRLAVLASLGSVAVCAALAAVVASTRSPELARHQEFLRIVDGEELAAALAARVRPGDRVVYGPNAGVGLRYHLRRHGLDGRIAVEYFRICRTPTDAGPCPPASVPRRVFVVVTRRPERQTLAGNLAGVGLEQAADGAREVASWKYTRLFVLAGGLPAPAG